MMKKFAFVLMPFSSSFNDIYEFGIRGACQEANIYCERVDEQIFTERILDRIYNQINKADIIIADMSTKNPNVFYEVGYAHALNKNVILLTQSENDIPFDFKHFPHIIYGDKISYLKENLTKKLIHFVASGSAVDSSAIELIDIYVSNKNIREKPKIRIKENSRGIWSTMQSKFTFQMSLNNTSDLLFSDSCYISLLVPKEIINMKDEASFIDIPGDNYIYKVGHLPTIYPKSWEKQEITIMTKELDDTFHGVREYSSKIMVNTSLGMYEYDIVLELIFDSVKRKEDINSIPF